MQPHRVDVLSVLVLWQLNGPLSSGLVGIVLPSRDDRLLHFNNQVRIVSKQSYRDSKEAAADLEEEVVGFRRKLRRGNDVVVEPAFKMHASVSSPHPFGLEDIRRTPRTPQRC